MKYFLDTEFIENGVTIDLISIGIVSEDGRELYLQNVEAKFSTASDWVWRNVFPHLQHFQFAGNGGPGRNCNRESHGSLMDHHTWCSSQPPNLCPWRSHAEIRDLVRDFCLPEGEVEKPEFWGYYCDYDWVAFCQLFGRMIDLPKEFPMYCRDLKQLADQLGNPKLPKVEGEHNALTDAKWNQSVWSFLNALPAKP